MTYRKPCERQANVGHTLNRTSYGSASALSSCNPPARLVLSQSVRRRIGLGFPNTAKQAEPDPDIRASRQPSVARSAESTSPISGAIAIAGGSRSLRQDKADRDINGGPSAWRIGERRPRDEQACEKRR